MPPESNPSIFCLGPEQPLPPPKAPPAAKMQPAPDAAEPIPDMVGAVPVQVCGRPGLRPARSTDPEQPRPRPRPSPSLRPPRPFPGAERAAPEVLDTPKPPQAPAVEPALAEIKKPRRE